MFSQSTLARAGQIHVEVNIMGSGNSRVMTGALVGTGSAIDVTTVGFRPKAVTLFNVDSDDSLRWTDTMADATGYKSVKAGANAVISSGGITPLADGFTFGADTDMNVATQVVHFVAYE
jgi:hypothetical protein